MMSESREKEERKDVFIRLHGESMKDFEQAIKVIEQSGGRILHSFPLQVVVAEVPVERISSLRRRSEFKSVVTGRVSPSEADTDELKLAARTWNAHMWRQQHPKTPEPPPQGLTWDSPGFLPPDPPPEIRARLAKREREMKLQKERSPRKDPKKE